MFEQQGRSEEYFSTISSPARRIIQDVVEIRASVEDEWEQLNDKDCGKILDERLIDSVSAPKPQKYHTLDSRRRNKNKCSQQQQVRLSTFGVEQVFPRLKIQSGQKKVQETTESGDLTDSCYTYRDEHSAPFSWMTRSQQELRFESGTPDLLSEEEIAENGLECLRTTSPATTTSSGSNRQSLQLIRQSRGNPSFAKPVQIPQVPHLVMSPTEPEKRRSVSPHRINNFVCGTSPNRLVLDFGGNNDSKEDSASGGSDCSSAKSSSTSTGLLAKMKQRTKSSLKRSLSQVSKHRNKTRDSSPTSSVMTASSISITHTSLSSLASASTLTAATGAPQSKSNSLARNSITKPSYAPPPPPITKPTCAPPPPPVRKSPPKDEVALTPTPTLASQPKSAPNLIKERQSCLSNLKNPKVPTLTNFKIKNPSLGSLRTSLRDQMTSLTHAKEEPVIAPKSQPLESTKPESSSTKLTVTNTDEFQEPKIEPKIEDFKHQKSDLNHPFKAESSLDEFKIDLKVESDIPKTGFDFLDDW